MLLSACGDQRSTVFRCTAIGADRIKAPNSCMLRATPQLSLDRIYSAASDVESEIGGRTLQYRGWSSLPLDDSRESDLKLTEGRDAPTG
jgi:hypothetical protein